MTMTALGHPDHELDYAYRGNTLEGAEKVWLGRGALVVASPHVKGLLRVGVFAPSSLDDYRNQLQFVDIEDVDQG
jgi:hypothetical protein